MEERKQKTNEGCPREDRLEAEVIEGAQTYMEITEGRLAEVQIDEKHLMELILSPHNMNRAYRKVVSNGGSGGVDSMEAKDLLPYLKLHKDELRDSILNGKYKPMPVRRVEIPKDNGKTRKLGIPTLVDRVIQQSIAQVLTPMYEPQFSEGSYGFRPNRSAQGALKQAQKILDEGYEYAVGIDLERFFDTVNQSYLIELLSHHKGRQGHKPDTQIPLCWRDGERSTSADNGGNAARRSAQSAAEQHSAQRTGQGVGTPRPSVRALRGRQPNLLQKQEGRRTRV